MQRKSHDLEREDQRNQIEEEGRSKGQHEKTKPCVFYQQGRCDYTADECWFLHVKRRQDEGGEKRDQYHRAEKNGEMNKEYNSKRCGNHRNKSVQEWKSKDIDEDYEEYDDYYEDHFLEKDRKKRGRYKENKKAYL